MGQGSWAGVSARAALIGTLLLPAAAQATNGITFFAFGARSSLVGGADVAQIGDTAASVTNPAGLARIEGPLLEVSADPYYASDVRHRDDLGNDRHTEPRTLGFVNMAYAQPLAEEWFAGLGLFAAGGLGFSYEDLDTGRGNRDDLSNRFSVIRLAPALAWRPAPGLALGISVPVNLSTLRLKNFYDTSVFNPLDAVQIPLIGGNVGQESFFGNRVDGAFAVGYGLAAGLQYALSRDLTLGLAVRTRSRLKFDSGSVSVNFESLGAGRIRYRDAQVDGVHLPMDVQVGLAWAAAPGWLLSAEYTWINTEDAMRQLTIRARDPDRNPMPLLVPDQIEQVQPLFWKDQHVLAVGAVHALSGNLNLRLGYNYGRSPVPKSTLAPLLAAIPEHHYTAGLEYTALRHWDLISGLVYLAHHEERYANALDPTTRNASETHESLVLLISASYHFGGRD